MQKRLHSYISFTAREKVGLSVLLVLLMVLIAVKATLHLWVRPTVDSSSDVKMQAAWQDFVASQPPKKLSQNITVNINTADSATLVQLKGIGPVTASRIMLYRKEKAFTHIEELREVGSFSEQTLAELEKRIAF